MTLAGTAALLAAVVAAMMGVAIGRAGKEANTATGGALAAARAMTFTTAKPDQP